MAEKLTRWGAFKMLFPRLPLDTIEEYCPLRFDKKFKCMFSSKIACDVCCCRYWSQEMGVKVRDGE